MAYLKFAKTDFADSVKLAKKILKRGRKKIDTSNYVRALLVVAGGKGLIAHHGGIVQKLINAPGIIQYFKKAEKILPETPEVLYGVGSFHLLSSPMIGGGVDKAIKYLEKAVKMNPLFPDAYVRLAQAYLVKGDSDKYSLNLKKALTIDPGNELALDIKNGSCKFVCIHQKKKK